MFMNKKKKRDLFGLMGKDQFQLLLRVERARADREGPSFSLVLFKMNEIYTNNYIKEFIQLLQARIRMVDFIGWFDDTTIGIILFSTNIVGANRFILDVEKKTNTIFPIYTVFSYPDQWINNSDKPDYEINRNGKKDESNKNSGDTDKIMDKVTAFFAKPIPFWKRVVDIFGSLVGLIILAPLFAITALYIKIVSPGPVFFTQDRVGRKGKLFTFIKFRTMHVNNDVSGHAAYLKNLINNENPMEKLDNKKDPRIIPGGQILRKTCIDELPQLINVLRGEMSLIGPRPCIQYEAKEYSVWHHQRFDVLPGMTGLWQVSGKNNLSFKQMIRLDINYGDKMSLLLDLKILVLTIPTVLGLIFDKFIKKLAILSAYPLHKDGQKILDFNGSKSNFRGDYAKERKQSV